MQEWTVTGTHRGELLGMPPTGRWTESYGAVITTFDDDAVMIEGALYWNPLAMLQPARARADAGGRAA